MFLKTLFTNFIPLQVNYWHAPALYVILCKKKTLDLYLRNMYFIITSNS